MTERAKEFRAEINREFSRIMRLAFREEHTLKGKLWRHAHAREVKEYGRRHYAETIDRQHVRRKAWRLRNPDKVKQYRQTTHERHGDLIKQKNREDYHENKFRRIATIKVWQKNNLHKRREYLQRRRLLKRGINGGTDCSSKIWLLLTERFCRWCCRPLNIINRTIDHIIPLMRGGLHIPDNLAAACRPCNCSKSDKLISEWQWKPYEGFEEVAV